MPSSGIGSPPEKANADAQGPLADAELEQEYERLLQQSPWDAIGWVLECGCELMCGESCAQCCARSTARYAVDRRRELERKADELRAAGYMITEPA